MPQVALSYSNFIIHNIRQYCQKKTAAEENKSCKTPVFWGEVRAGGYFGQGFGRIGGRIVSAGDARGVLHDIIAGTLLSFC